jgi:hypothetical protein
MNKNEINPAVGSFRSLLERSAAEPPDRRVPFRKACPHCGASLYSLTTTHLSEHAPFGQSDDGQIVHGCDGGGAAKVLAPDSEV